MSGPFTDQAAMLFSTPITLSLVLLEIFISVRFDKQYYKVKDTKANLVLGLGYVIIDTLSRGAGILLLVFFMLMDFTFPFLPAVLFYIGSYWYWQKILLIGLCT